VHVHRHGERAVLRVEDSGMGIQPELLPRIFDLFVQGAREADRADGGLGIGLTLVKRLVELHDGTVQAESAGPGTGTTFVVSLPALSLSAAEEPRQLSAASPPSRRIVLVEDNADSRETLRVLFELYGHEVHEADDGPSGVETVLRVQPEAAFVDVGLPGFDGYEVARRIRSSPSGKGVYLVAVTGYGLASDKSRAREAGFDGHVVKPVNPAEVNALLRDLGSRGG
jgi:CheY-like chemotaxis protein